MPTATIAPRPAIVEDIIKMAERYGDMLMQGLDTITSEQKTSQGDLVTPLDLAIQEGLTADLSRLLDAPVLGEEHVVEGPIEPGLVWTIDPIDGTTNAAHGHPYSSVVITLLEDGAPVLAIVHNPFTDKTYHTYKGLGSYVRHLGADRALRPSLVQQLRTSLLSFGIWYDRSLADHTFEIIREIFRHSQDIRRGGSAALDLSHVAAGSLDAHVEPIIHVWDAAGPSLILQEAGGMVTDWAGRPIRWERREQESSMVASNGVLHEELLAVIASPDGAQSRPENN